LGEEIIKDMKRKVGIENEQSFYLPEEVIKSFSVVGQRGKEKYEKWLKLNEKYSEEFKLLNSHIKKEFPVDWDKVLPKFENSKSLATRECSGECLNAISDPITNMIGGSADLTPSNNTFLKKSKDFNKNQYEGKYLRFGVREHAMISICNGIAYYGVLIPYCATFLIFSGYGLGNFII
jgi:transketolase